VLNVHFRVNDATTGKPTPVRLRISDAAGEWYVPWGRYRDFPTGRHEQVGGCVYLDGTKYVYIDGSCELPLPAGVPVTVDISKGPEYLPIRETVTLGAGQMAMRFNLTRWIDTHADGWITADARVHDLNPCDAWLEAAAEGVDFAHVLLTEHDMPSQDGHLYRSVPNLTAFSGQQSAIEKDGVTVAVNTFHSHPVLGHVGLLHSHRPIFPLSFGGDEATDDWSICDWCDQCHRKGGLTVLAEPFTGEGLIAAILGKIDAVEWAPGGESAFLPAYYRLLNAGIRIPLVGASGKCGNRTAVGAMRTYARSERTLPGWVDAVRAGRTFVTNGPLIDLRVNDKVPPTDNHREHPQAFHIDAKARSGTPFEQLEIIANGEVVAMVAGDGSPCEAEINHDVMPFRGGWSAVRVRGPGGLIAHTSPIWLDFEGTKTVVDARAVAAIRKQVEATREWAEQVGRYEVPKRRTALLERCDAATELLSKR